MEKAEVEAVLGRVLIWPAGAQAEAVASLRAIEHEWTADDYHATPDEQAAIDEAEGGEVAGGEEVEAAFRSFRAA